MSRNKLTIEVNRRRDDGSSTCFPSPYSSPVNFVPEFISVHTNQNTIASTSPWSRSPRTPAERECPSLSAGRIPLSKTAVLARQASDSLLQAIHERVDVSISSNDRVLQKQRSKEGIAVNETPSDHATESPHVPVAPGSPSAKLFRLKSSGPEVNSLLSSDYIENAIPNSTSNDSINDSAGPEPADTFSTVGQYIQDSNANVSTILNLGDLESGAGGNLEFVSDALEIERKGVRFATGQTMVRLFTPAPAYDGEDPIRIPNDAAIASRLGGGRGSGAGLADALNDREYVDNKDKTEGEAEIIGSSLSIKNGRGLMSRCCHAVPIAQTVGGSVRRILQRSGDIKTWFFGLPMMMRMIIIVSVPVIAAVVLSSIGLNNHLIDRQAAVEIQEELAFHRAANHLMHHLQKEKTALRYSWYSTSQDAMDKRDSEMMKTDEARNEFLSFLGSWKKSASSPAIKVITTPEAYSVLMQSLSGLERHRHLVLKKLIPLSEVSSLYQNAIISIVTLASGSLDEVHDLNLSNSMSGFLDLALLDDSVDQELDFIGVSFLSGEFGSLESIGEANRRAGIMESAWNTFQDTAAYEHHAKPFFTTPEVTASLATMRRLRQQILTYSPTLGTGSANGSSIRYEDFVAASSSFLDAVDESSVDLIDSIDETAAQLKKSAEAGVTPVAVIVGVVVVVSGILVWILILSIQVTDRAFLNEAALRRTTEAAIWRFFPQEFMTLLNHSDIMSVQCGDRRVLGDSTTIIVADLRRFTTASEQLGPDATYDWLMEYVKVVGTVIQSHGGFIEKTLGDGIVAMFTDPQLALKAAIEMQIAVQQTNLSRGFHMPWPYNVGIGVHSGEVVLGILGDSNRLMGSIVSDTVAIANKVEGLTKSYGAKILISGSTLRQCDMSEIGHRLVGSVRVTGDSTELLELYEVYEADERSMAEFKDETREEFEKAVKLFRMRNFDESTEILEDLQSRIPRGSDGGVDRRVHLVGSAVRDGLSQNWIGED